MMCAKLIHHAGIGKVIIVDGGFGGENGIDYLGKHGVEIKRMKDRRNLDSALNLTAPSSYHGQATGFSSTLFALVPGCTYFDDNTSEKSSEEITEPEPILGCTDSET